MPYVDEPEDYEESSDENQEDNHTPNFTRNGDSNRGEYPPGMFYGAEGHTINDGYFEAKNGAKNFIRTKEFTIRGGKYKASNDGWQRGDPNANRTEMFTGSSGHIIHGGEFTTTGDSSAFAHTNDYVINGGTFTATGTSHTPTQYQASVNYGTYQGNAPPRPPQGQQGYESRSFSMGYVACTSSTSHPPTMHAQYATYNGPLNDPIASGSNFMQGAPIPPNPWAQGFSYNGGNNPNEICTSQQLAKHPRYTTLNGPFHNRIASGSNLTHGAPIPPNPWGQGYSYNGGKGPGGNKAA